MRISNVAITLMAVALLSGASAALAQGARPDIRTMTCAQARAIVDRQGSAMLTYGPYLYDRFVSSPSSCGFRSGPRPEYQPTRDNARCFVGYTCGPTTGGR